MIVQTAEIEMHMEPGIQRAPEIERQFLQARKAFRHTRTAIETLCPLDTLPTATERYRGRFAFVRGGTGVADALYLCHKDSTDVYVWTQVV